MVREIIRDFRKKYVCRREPHEHCEHMFTTLEWYETIRPMLLAVAEEAKRDVKDYFKETGRQGGETTKKKTDYVALGKKGAAKRWQKPRKKI